MKRFADVVFNIFLTSALLATLGLFWTAKAGAPGVHTEWISVPPVETHTDTAAPVVIECVVVNMADEPKPIYSQEELDMLALVIYQEAGSDVCSDEARMMVGNVVLNRVADPRFPNTIYEVLTEVTASGFGAYGRLHWTGIVWPERANYLSEAHAVQRAYSCAERLLNGERVLPDDVVWQAEFVQGTEVVEHVGGFYFCR